MKQNEDAPIINRIKVSSVTLYEVTEGELRVLEKGPAASIYLIFAMSLLSIGVTVFTTLLAVGVQSPHVLSVLSTICFCGFALGIIYLVLWMRNRSDFKRVLKNIRERSKN